MRVNIWYVSEFCVSTANVAEVNIEGGWLILKADIRFLWVRARSVAAPFEVQDFNKKQGDLFVKSFIWLAVSKELLIGIEK